MSVIAQLSDELREQMVAHAEAEQPRECCGLLVRVAGVLQYRRARNVFPVAALHGQDRFRLDPEDWAAAEDAGTIVAVVHSHPLASANPSMADRVGCERSGVPWVVVGWPSGVMRECEPEGYEAPYERREFSHGILDCYTLVQDWYRRELGQELPWFERWDDWWVSRQGKPGADLYMRHFGEASFTRVQGVPQLHDVILMQVKADQANHAAVYVGNGAILHHLWGRLSCKDVYGGYWQRHTAALLRHRSRWMAEELAA